jgi:hypothetical protein
VFVHDPDQLGGNLIEGLIPGDLFKGAPHALERVGESLGVMLVVGNVHPLATDIPLASRVLLVGPNFDDAVLFDYDLQSAVLSAQHTTRLLPVSHCLFLLLRFDWISRKVGI